MSEVSPSGAVMAKRSGVGSRLWSGGGGVSADLRRRVAHYLLPCVLLAVALGSAVRLFGGAADELNNGPVAHMRDLAGGMAGDIASLADDGIAKTNALAADPRVAAVIANGDRGAGERLANELLQQSLELDIVSIFDGDGRLLAVNTVGHDGKPVREAGLRALYAADFSGRDVVQECLRNDSTRSAMEFQTHCDFTPALYGSSGLSVAMSAPVVSGAHGERVGVLSTRLRFDRVTSLVRENSFIRAGNSVYLVSDDGHFFDERVNSGLEAPPLAADRVVSVFRSGPGADGEVVWEEGDTLMLAQRVPVDAAVCRGGIQVLLSASRDWVSASERRSLVSAGAVLILSLVAVGFWWMYAGARANRLRALVALSSERARMSLILENVGEGVLGIDGDGCVSFVNVSAAAMLGRRAGSVVGTAVAGLVPAFADRGVGRAWALDDTLIYQGGGGSFHARVSMKPLPDGSGGVLSFSDLTERLETERDLLEATRLAGKAEVATSVLHNVGNVLNSINVSASVVAELVRESEVGSLVSAGALIREHREDLAGFLTSDERGRYLPEFLIEVAECLGHERARLLREMEGVLGGVEHVRHVVSMQQAHAKSPNLLSDVEPSALMDTALSMQQESLSNHEVRLERAYSSIGPRLLDKHQVLQILLNLVKNAKQAMSEARSEERVLILGVREVEDAGERWVEFEVRDNGVGIAAEHRTKMFSHGFTTRRDGHGFGLHTSANSAKQMGGSLEVESDGLGKGARFVLRLPVELRSRCGGSKEAGCIAS